MIKSLRIENFILVDKLELHFGSGLQVVTGETGAGKSIIIGAIETIFSGVIKPGMVFDETSSALLEINLDLSIKNEDLKNLLETYEVDISEGEVFFSRTIYPGNRSKVFLNGRRISNKIAEEFKFAIMDFHSQKDHQKLMDNSYQLSILDKFGNHTSRLNKFRINFLELKEKYKKITDMLSNEKEL
ncbi:MAG: AAA family ATPase, partial [Candidatus Cloacimonetes bacterium]|nr:AAA family ATPase [Candidatus Cloacimonadota bacterium]